MTQHADPTAGTPRTLSAPGASTASSPAPSCHADAGGPAAPTGAPVVALAGAPNGGKSTLFNALTGARRTMGNWPGTSVEVGRGAWRVSDAHGQPTAYDLVDLPGSYSLDPNSPDEELTRALLVDPPLDERPDLTIVTVDAAHLARALYLVSQIRELPGRVIVALSMVDVAARRGVRIDTDALAEALGVPVVAIDARRRSGLDALARATADALDAPPARPRPHTDTDDEFARADERFTWVDAAVVASTHRDSDPRRSGSDRIDAVVLNRVAGPLIFLAVMWAVFQVTTTVAAPLQDALDAFFTGPVTDGATWLLETLHVDHPLVHGFIVNGLVAGVGMLLTFVPLMALMFLLLSLLEDSGYMARAAVVADRTMRRIGLPGRAFLPLIVGFGCNVPAVSATRVLSGARQRVLTALLVPFTSCSARLTVYVMLAATFFPDHAGTVVFAMYLVSILLIVLVGLGLRHTLWRTMGNEPLMLDLPPYQRPALRIMASVTWTRLQGFLRTAGGIIVVTVSLVWLLQSVPAGTGEKLGEVPVGHSVYAATARTVSPLFAPAGFDQWQTTGALVTGFVAKEAVISSWAQTYSLDDSTTSGHAALQDHIRESFDRSSGGHPGPAAVAFMFFLLAYTPCVATLAAQRREIGWRWTAFGLGLQLVVAYALAVGAFQLGRLWW